MTVQSPRREIPIVDGDGHLTATAFDLLQALVDSINGKKDENGFLYTLALGIRITVGTGSPETVVTGARPDLFLRTNGAAGSTAYYKGSGTAKVGWVALP